LVLFPISIERLIYGFQKIAFQWLAGIEHRVTMVGRSRLLSVCSTRMNRRDFGSLIYINQLRGPRCTVI
jgi:hypothetical protein